MEISLLDIKQAFIFIFDFDSQKFGNDSSTYYHAAKIPEPFVGLLEDEYFLDIETCRLYPIMFMKSEQEITKCPTYGIEYACLIESYKPKDKKNKMEILEKAKKAHEWYSHIRKEENSNLLFFEKEKYKLMGNEEKEENDNLLSFETEKSKIMIKDRKK